MNFVPRILIANITADFISFSVTTENTVVIYLIDSPLKSYKPGRDINGIEGFEQGKGYYCICDRYFDWGESIITSSQIIYDELGNAIVDDEGNPIVSG